MSVFVLHAACPRVWPVLMLVSALALGACQSKQAKLDADPLNTGSTSSLAKTSDVGSFTRTEALSKQWGANQSNAKVGLDYADNLGKMGQTDQQMDVLKTEAATNPNDGALQSRIGNLLWRYGNGGVLAHGVARPGDGASDDDFRLHGVSPWW